MNKVIETDRAKITLNDKHTDINNYSDVYFRRPKRLVRKLKRKANWEQMQKKYKGE